ncbi:MAG: protoheme IX farnesyltransferase, partial [Casimicrobiaceae bacterium]
FTRLMIVLYTVILVAVTMLPFAIGMSGLPYLGAALLLGALYLKHAVGLYRHYSDQRARAAFKFSIAYLAALFSALLLDHYWR